MPLQVLILLDFMVQLHIDGMPVKVFADTAAWLVHVLTIAEGTPTSQCHCQGLMCGNELS